MTRISGLKALVVEDEGVIAFMLEDMLREIGCEIVAWAANLRSACEAARTASFDFALLDVNLGGEQAFPAAEILDSRKIPFVFSTGYGPAIIPRVFANRPVLTKPFNIEELQQTIVAAMAAK
jgi:CheY-like chemotaxis protein